MRITGPAPGLWSGDAERMPSSMGTPFGILPATGASGRDRYRAPSEACPLVSVGINRFALPAVFWW